MTDERGACLTISEPAPLSQNRIKPYRFSLNYRFTSEQEAWEVLNQYLKTCGTQLLDSDRPDRTPAFLQPLQQMMSCFSAHAH